MLVAIIMAGGAGTRFWPLSTEKKPKQFLRLFGERTLLQQSYDRIAALVPAEQVLVLTNQRFVPLVRDQLPSLPADNIIGEPHRRDTAAAVALAAVLCQHRFGNPTMAILTADHLIPEQELFLSAIRSAVKGAEDGAEALYTFGVRPTFAATGYGYLQCGERLFAKEGIEHFQLTQFREKPDQTTAERYLQSGEYLWNSGMFVWSTRAIMRQLQQHLPAHLQQLQPVMSEDGHPGWSAALARAFAALPAISIDCAVMEKASPMRCVAASFSWSDVGGWLALEEFLPGDGVTRNRHRGELKAVSADNNLVFCEEQDELVGLVGVKDLIIIRSGKHTLIVDRQHTEAIKKLVLQLEPHRR